MTREEQIMQAAKELWLVEDNICDTATFQKGAEWADSNPNWHKYPDEKPKPMQRVFVAYYHANIDRLLVNISKLIPSDKADPKCTCYLWSNLINECDRVIAWIELPQPPKFD